MKLWSRHLVARLSLLGLASTLYACEMPGFPGTGEEDDSPPDEGSVDPKDPESGDPNPEADKNAPPCDPWLAPTPAVGGDLQIAVGSMSQRFFVVDQDSRLRLFENDGDFWIERKVTGGSRTSESKGKLIKVALTFEDRNGGRGRLAYRIEEGRPAAAALIPPGSDEEDVDIEDIPGASILNPVDGFKLPQSAKLRPIPLTKSLRFFAEFGDDEYIAVLVPSKLLDNYQEGVFIGSADAVTGPRNIKIRRAKDGGSLYFRFPYRGKEAHLSLPVDVSDDENGPSLTLNGHPVKLSNQSEGQNAKELLAPLTFRHCDRAHQGRS